MDYYPEIHKQKFYLNFSMLKVPKQFVDYIKKEFLPNAAGALVSSKELTIKDVVSNMDIRNLITKLKPSRILGIESLDKDINTTIDLVITGAMSLFVRKLLNSRSKKLLENQVGTNKQDQISFLLSNFGALQLYMIDSITNNKSDSFAINFLKKLSGTLFGTMTNSYLKLANFFNTEKLSKIYFDFKSDTKGDDLKFLFDDTIESGLPFEVLKIHYICEVKTVNDKKMKYVRKHIEVKWKKNHQIENIIFFQREMFSMYRNVTEFITEREKANKKDSFHLGAVKDLMTALVFNQGYSVKDNIYMYKSEYAQEINIFKSQLGVITESINKLASESKIEKYIEKVILGNTKNVNKIKLVDSDILELTKEYYNSQSDSKVVNLYSETPLLKGYQQDYDYKEFDDKVNRVEFMNFDKQELGGQLKKQVEEYKLAKNKLTNFVKSKNNVSNNIKMNPVSQKKFGKVVSKVVSNDDSFIKTKVSRMESHNFQKFMNRNSDAILSIIDKNKNEIELKTIKFVSKIISKNIYKDEQEKLYSETFEDILVYLPEHRKSVLEKFDNANISTKWGEIGTNVEKLATSIKSCETKYKIVKNKNFVNYALEHQFIKKPSVQQVFDKSSLKGTYTEKLNDFVQNGEHFNFNLLSIQDKDKIENTILKNHARINKILLQKIAYVDYNSKLLSNHNEKILEEKIVGTQIISMNPAIREKEEFKDLVITIQTNDTQSQNFVDILWQHSKYFLDTYLDGTEPLQMSPFTNGSGTKQFATGILISNKQLTKWAPFLRGTDQNVKDIILKELYDLVSYNVKTQQEMEIKKSLKNEGHKLSTKILEQ
jgi:hypothetical protein